MKKVTTFFSTLTLAIFLLASSGFYSQIYPASCGLKNNGNTCYQNALLQAMYQCEPLRDLVKEIFRDNASPYRGFMVPPLLESLRDVFTNLPSSGVVYDPIDFAHNVWALPGFKAYDQEDSTDLFSHIAKAFDEGLRRPLKRGQGFRAASKIICSRDHERMAVGDSIGWGIPNIQLNFPQRPEPSYTLREMVNLWAYEEEAIDGIQCAECKVIDDPDRIKYRKNVEQERPLRVTQKKWRYSGKKISSVEIDSRARDFLILTIKRFPNLFIKNRTPVTCPAYDDLEMGYVPAGQFSFVDIHGKRHTFRVVSVVVHRGSILSGGHYYAVTQAGEFNDWSVELSPEHLRTLLESGTYSGGEGYMYFCERVADPERRGADFAGPAMPDPIPQVEPALAPEAADAALVGKNIMMADKIKAAWKSKKARNTLAALRADKQKELEKKFEKEVKAAVGMQKIIRGKIARTRVHAKKQNLELVTKQNNALARERAGLQAADAESSAFESSVRHEVKIFSQELQKTKTPFWILMGDIRRLKQHCRHEERFDLVTVIDQIAADAVLVSITLEEPLKKQMALLSHAPHQEALEALVKGNQDLFDQYEQKLRECAQRSVEQIAQKLYSVPKEIFVQLQALNADVDDLEDALKKFAQDMNDIHVQEARQFKDIPSCADFINKRIPQILASDTTYSLLVEVVCDMSECVKSLSKDCARILALLKDSSNKHAAQEASTDLKNLLADGIEKLCELVTQAAINRDVSSLDENFIQLVGVVREELFIGIQELFDRGLIQASLGKENSLFDGTKKLFKKSYRSKKSAAMVSKFGAKEKSTAPDKHVVPSRATVGMTGENPLYKKALPKKVTKALVSKPVEPLPVAVVDEAAQAVADKIEKVSHDVPMQEAEVVDPVVVNPKHLAVAAAQDQIQVTPKVEPVVVVKEPSKDMLGLKSKWTAAYAAAKAADPKIKVKQGIEKLLEDPKVLDGLGAQDAQEAFGDQLVIVRGLKEFSIRTELKSAFRKLLALLNPRVNDDIVVPVPGPQGKELVELPPASKLDKPQAKAAEVVPTLSADEEDFVVKFVEILAYEFEDAKAKPAVIWSKVLDKSHFKSMLATIYASKKTWVDVRRRLENRGVTIPTPARGFITTDKAAYDKVQAILAH